MKKCCRYRKRYLGSEEIQDVLGFKKITKTRSEPVDILISTFIAILTALTGIYTIYKLQIIFIPKEPILSISWMVTLAILVVIAMAGYFYYNQLMVEKYKKRMKIIDESVEKETNVIRELRNLAEKDIETLRHNIDQISISLPEKPSSEAKEKFDELNQRLELLEVLGASLKPEDYNNRGTDLFHKGNYQLSLKAYEKALELKPDYTVALNNKGSVLIRLNRFDEALETFNKAIELN